MTTKELKAMLGEYSGLLLYPQTEQQEADKLPYTKSYWRIAHMQDSAVDASRINVISGNIDMHINRLKELKETIKQQ